MDFLVRVEGERIKIIRMKYPKTETSLLKSFGRFLVASMIFLVTIIAIFILTCTRTGSPLDRGLLYNGEGETTFTGTEANGLICPLYDKIPPCMTRKIVVLNIIGNRVIDKAVFNKTAVNLEDIFPLWIIVKWAPFHEQRYQIEKGSWIETITIFRGKYIEIMTWKLDKFLTTILVYIVFRMQLLDNIILTKREILALFLLGFGTFIIKQWWMLDIEEQITRDPTKVCTSIIG